MRSIFYRRGKPASLTLFAICILAGLLIGSHAQAQEPRITSYQASSTLNSWPLSRAFDGVTGTSWSSFTHPSAGSAEWIAFWFAGFNNINYVRLKPRFDEANQALGFPVTFTIYYSNGSQWITSRTVVAMQRPYRNADIILTFPTAYCNGIHIVATTLGDDEVGNYVFHLDEARAGYDPDFANKMVWIGRGAGTGQIEMRNVGARDFNPNRLTRWHYDVRNPIIQPNFGTYRNIYAAAPVNNGPGRYNVFFGGWDGSGTGNDKVSLTVTLDKFKTFGPHVLVINNGSYMHVNNESVIKVGPNDWRMAYTTYASMGLNKPCYATSADGVSWTPNTGNPAYLMTMSGYAGWANADLNGMNVIYHDGTRFHMYFGDFNNWPGVHHATSPNNINYTYEQELLNDGVIVNDMKKFTVSGSPYYIWGYHANGDRVYYSLGPNPSNAGIGVRTLFLNKGAPDRYIVSCGFVRDANKLIGCLFGAGPVSSLDQNRIFARWLQRMTLFSNASVRWGDIEESVGPDTTRVYMAAGQHVETGKIKIFAEDGTTLEYTSPLLTILAGDIWESRY